MIKAKTLIFVILSVFLMACNGPKSLTKKGNKFSDAGIHREAVKFYIKALKKKSSHVDAQIGLQNSGRAILNEYTSTFFKAYSTDDNKTAVYTYLEMEEFVQKVKQYNVELRIHQTYTDDFESAKTNYLEKQFSQANELISQEKFNEANALFAEIEKIDPNFKGQDFDALKEIALLEPYYRRGSKYLNNEKYRSAYWEFKFIKENNSNYKDAKFKFNDALENARYTIGLVRFQNLSADKSTSEYISSHLTDEILKSNDPFVKLIDRSNMDRIIKEQMMHLEGVTDGSTTIKAGELAGAKALLTGTVLKVEKSHQKPTAKKTKAYKAYRVKKHDAAKDKTYYETKYKKTSYSQYDGFNKVTISFKYQLVSTETGQILLSDIIELSNQSKVSYATYSGNYKELVPGDWKYLNTASQSDHVNTKSSAKRALRNKFSSNRNLTPLSKIQSNLQQSVAKKTAKGILNFNPEQ